MNHLQNVFVVFLNLFLFFLLWQCSQSTAPKDEITDYILSPSVLELDETTKSKIISIDEQGTIKFSQNTATLKKLSVGKIIAVEPSDIVPNGLLKKVINVQTINGQVIVNTTNSTLSEAFESLSLNQTISLKHSDIESAQQLKKGIFLDNTIDDDILVRMINVVFYDDGTGNIILGSGKLEIIPSFMLQLVIKNNEVEKFTFLNTTTQTAELKIISNMSVGDDFEEEIEPIVFKPFIIWVSSFPIVIKPVLTIKVGAEINANVHFETGLSQEATVKVGLQYENNNWSTIQQFSKSFTPIYPELTASLTAYGYTGPKLSLLLYGVAGPYATLRGYLDFTANLSSTPWWALYGGAKVGAGVEVLFLGENIASYEKDDIIQYRELIAQAENAIQGNITGIIKDGVTGIPLSGVSINAWKNNVTVGSTYSMGNGIYNFEVQAGILDSVVYKLSGYLPAVYTNVEVIGFNTTHLEPVLQIDQAHAGNGNINGKVVNALNGYGVSNLLLKLRKDLNNRTGIVIKSAYTDDYGYYSFEDLDAGNYTIEASGSGYNTAYFSVICLGGQTTSGQNGTINPILDENEIRIILTWGKYPYDLDSHLTGPTPEDDRFHVYFFNKSYSLGNEQYVFLDRDDTQSYGPETITILKQISGVYRYSVHDYSNRELSYSSALSESNAQVRVYKGNDLIETFYVPSDQDGTLWTVFELTGGIITPKNIMSYAYWNSDISKQPPEMETDENLIYWVTKKVKK